MKTRVVTAAGWLALVAGWACGQEVIPPDPDPFCVFIDYTGVTIPPWDPSPPDVTRVSSTSLPIESSYRFNFTSPSVKGIGLYSFAAAPWGEVLDYWDPGSRRFLKGAVRDTATSRPVQLGRDRISGIAPSLIPGIPLNLDLTIVHKIRSDNKGEVSITDIDKTLGLGLEFVSGGSYICTWTPPAPEKSEWHFDGDLRSVRETGEFPASGPAKIRYLDDCRFGSPPGGADCGFTDFQSEFGLASDFGVPGPHGMDDMIYETSPAYNEQDPLNPIKARPIGLTLFPNSSWEYSRYDHRHGQWTMVWDLYIPIDAWTAISVPTAVVPGQPKTPLFAVAALIQDHHNNGDPAGVGILYNFGDMARFGYRSVPPLPYDISIPQIRAEQWFRFAVSCDGYRTRQSRVYVNGEYVGTTGGHWIDASANPSQISPTRYHYSDDMLVNADDWTAWGQFPSPWALSPGVAPMASTACLFADPLGRSASIYISNFAYVDEAMTADQIAALGGPCRRGIFYWSEDPCTAIDYNGDCMVDFSDYLEFLNRYDREDPTADLNHDGLVDFGDYLEFLNVYNECTETSP